MTQRQDTRLFMQGAYPGYAGIIERALSEDPTFRDLCEDYQRCAIALEDVRQQKGSQQTGRITEYEQLLGELAEDIEHWLGSNNLS